MSLKVLIMDPDWRFNRQAASYLESRAHLVVSENRTDEALDHARRWQPDLVILSSELANEALGALYALEPRPAILLTGQMERYDIAWKAWQKGGDELLMKPVFRTSELHEAIIIALENAVTGTRKYRPAASA